MSRRHQPTSRFRPARAPGVISTRLCYDRAAAAQYFELMARVESCLRADLGRKSLHVVSGHFPQPLRYQDAAGNGATAKRQRSCRRAANQR